jgi:hypothetical protein
MTTNYLDDLTGKLTKKGYLECPLWVLQAPASRFAEYRYKWYATLEGELAILWATLEMLYDDSIQATEPPQE